MERIEAPQKPRFASPAVRALAESVLEIDHYELDGIPLFHLPGAGATILTLSFGIGSAHEPVPRRGMTHLAEHLLLTSIDRALDHSNGVTEPFRVTFTTRGSPSEASRFLRDVCESIANPRITRMHEEANVLRTEANLRSPAMPPQLRLYWLRTGYQGLGTTHLPEFFLHALDEQVLRDWIGGHMVAGNAAIWIAGTLPDDLYVALDPGPPTPVPAYEEIPGFETPTVLGDEIEGVGASFVVERSLAIQSALRTLEQHLRKALRVDRGLGYIVATDYKAVSATQSLASVFASCLPNSAPEVQRAVLEAIDDLAARGPTEDEIADQYESAVRDLTDPMANPTRLDHWVQGTLMGIEPIPAATVLDQLWRLQPDEVAAVFRKARDSMLLVLPPTSARPQRAWKAYPDPSGEGMGKGQTFEPSTKPKGGGPFGREPAPSLFIGNEGVTVEVGRGVRFVAIRWDEAVAVVRDLDARIIVARDGTSFGVSPEAWRDGKHAVALVDRWAPRPVVIPDAR
jgi:hypothetical protein